MVFTYLSANAFSHPLSGRSLFSVDTRPFHWRIEQLLIGNWKKMSPKFVGLCILWQRAKSGSHVCVVIVIVVMQHPHHHHPSPHTADPTQRGWPPAWHYTFSRDGRWGALGLYAGEAYLLIFFGFLQFCQMFVWKCLTRSSQGKFLSGNFKENNSRFQSGEVQKTMENYSSVQLLSLRFQARQPTQSIELWHHNTTRFSDFVADKKKELHEGAITKLKTCKGLKNGQTFGES